MSGPEWKGLFEWSMKYRDGTRPTDFSDVEVDPEKMGWLQNVLQNYVVEFNKRMEEIKDVFDSGENANASIEDKEKILEELQEIVESIDHAKNLHSIGGFDTLKEILECPHPSLRWRAAEVVATCVQNNLPVQKLFWEGGVAPLLINLLQDENNTCVKKGWLAISSLIRNFKPAELDLMKQQGMDLLLNAINNKDDSIKRRVLFLLQYLLNEDSEYRAEVVQRGDISAIVSCLCNDNNDLHEVALGTLIAIARDKEGRKLVKQNGSLAERLSNLREELVALTGEDRETVETEIELSGKLMKVLNASEDGLDGSGGEGGNVNTSLICVG